MPQCVVKKCKNDAADGFAVCTNHIMSPNGLMFGLWAIDKSVKGEGAHILIQATHHYHISQVLDQLTPPIPRLEAIQEYHKQKLLRQVCEELEAAPVFIGDSDEDTAFNLIRNSAYISADETVERLKPIVKEWRARMALQNAGV